MLICNKSGVDSNINIGSGSGIDSDIGIDLYYDAILLLLTIRAPII